MKYPKDCNIHRPPHTFLLGAYYFVSARTYFALPYLRENKNKQILLDSIRKAAEKFSVTVFGWVILDNHYHLLLKLPDEDNKMNLVTPAKIGSGRLQSVREGNELKLVSLGKVIGFIHGRSSRLLRKRETLKNQDILYDFTPQEFALLKHRFLKNLGERYLLTERRRVTRFKQLIETGNVKGLERFMKGAPKIWYQYLDHVINGETDFYRHLNYIHQNPVKHGFCKDLLDYKFSSIHKHVKEFGKEWITDCFRKYPIVDFQPSFKD